MILDLDAGNTRLKWRLSSAGAVHEGALVYGQPLPQLWRDLTQAGLRVRVASVNAEAPLEYVLDELVTVLGAGVERLQVRDHCAGLALCYEDVSLLGLDRWLAMLAAKNSHKNKNLLVIDCGTAVTFDVVSAEGLHQGGYIVPGLAMMRGALAGNTARVQVVSEVADLSLGKSTAQAVNNGALSMLCAQAFRLVEEYACGEGLLICGGDGHLLADAMGRPDSYAPTLVLDGIGIALP